MTQTITDVKINLAGGSQGDTLGTKEDVLAVLRANKTKIARVKVAQLQNELVEA